MRKFIKFFLGIAGAIALFWTGMTIWVQLDGPEFSVTYGDQNKEQKAIVIFDPDPIYNLDQQICVAAAEVLSNRGWLVEVKSVRSFKNDPKHEYDLAVYCANTYNWSPDRSVCGLIDDQSINTLNVAAITLGAGTTAGAHNKIKNCLTNTGHNILAETEIWLMRPNDETDHSKDNIIAAKEKAKTLANEIVSKLNF
jgi:hypothetical protein